MSQCVPSWEVDDNNHPPPSRVSLRSHSNVNSTAPDVPKLDYEVAELTWENGQLSMHGLGLPRVPTKISTTTPSKYTWDKPRASGTLESIVSQATSKSSFEHGGGGCGDNASGGGIYENVLVPWFDPHREDALVPCSNQEHSTHSIPRVGTGPCTVERSTRAGSYSGTGIQEDGALLTPAAKKRAGVSRDQSVSGSANFERDSRLMTLDTCDKEFGVGFTSTSMGSPDNTSSAKQFTKTVDDHDSVCLSRSIREEGDEAEKKKGTAKSSGSTKRSRAAAIHNQSERKRRDKINQRMKTLQKLVPNSSKTDKASMLDEVIEYLKQLQAQVQMVNRFNMSSMMLPMAMQPQLQMPMMTPMGMGMGMHGMGMGMGMGMDMNTMNRANIPGISPVLHPSPFMPMASWDANGGGERLQGPPQATVMPDPMSTFFGCQSQPMTMDAYSRIAAMYQQLHNLPGSGQQLQNPRAPGSKS